MKEFKVLLMLFLLVAGVFLLIADTSHAGWLRGSGGGCPGGQCPSVATTATATIDVPVVVNVRPAIKTKIIETAKKEQTTTSSRPIAVKLKATAKAPFRLLFRRW